MKWLDSLKERAWALKRELHALWLACRDPRTPRAVRWFIVCVVVYALSPIDLIPDPIPVLGCLDDLILLPLGIALALRMIPDAVMEDCRERVRTDAFELAPKWKWAGATAVIFVWLLAAGWVAWLLRGGWTTGSANL